MLWIILFFVLAGSALAGIRLSRARKNEMAELMAAAPQQAPACASESPAVRKLFHQTQLVIAEAESAKRSLEQRGNELRARQAQIRPGEMRSDRLAGELATALDDWSIQFSGLTPEDRAWLAGRGNSGDTMASMAAQPPAEIAGVQVLLRELYGFRDVMQWTQWRDG